MLFRSWQSLMFDISLRTAGPIGPSRQLLFQVSSVTLSVAQLFNEGTGSPRIWSSLPLPLSVPHDRGQSFVNQNAHRLPDYPMLPLFAAIDTLTANGPREAPQWTSVDIITDRNNLLKLAAWADASCSDPRKKKDFRIDFELIGNRTVLFQRWEERNSVRDQVGHGDTFERMASHPAVGCEDTTLAGHARVVAYVSSPFAVFDLVLIQNLRISLGSISSYVSKWTPSRNRLRTLERLSRPRNLRMFSARLYRH